MVALNETRRSPSSTAFSALFLQKNPPVSRSSPAPRIPSLQRARYYDPSTGEFTSRDPLEYVDGLTLYRGYFSIENTDPLGRQLSLCLQVVKKPTVAKICIDIQAIVGFYFEYFAPETAASTNGYIIQRVTWRYDSYHCATKKLADNPPKSYFEAWKVVSGVVVAPIVPPVPMPVEVGHDLNSVRGDLIGYYGSAGATYEVGFVRGYVLTRPPWDFPGDDGHVADAGDAPTLLPPHYPAGWESILRRDLDFEYYCCEAECAPSPPKTTVITNSFGYADMCSTPF